jgi:hypothetical protein
MACSPTDVKIMKRNVAEVCGRDMLEEVMDDEDEVREMNLSSRPLREERRRQRERERIERGVERYFITVSFWSLYLSSAGLPDTSWT